MVRPQLWSCHRRSLQGHLCAGWSHRLTGPEQALWKEGMLVDDETLQGWYIDDGLDRVDYDPEVWPLPRNWTCPLWPSPSPDPGRSFQRPTFGFGLEALWGGANDVLKVWAVRSGQSCRRLVRLTVMLACCVCVCVCVCVCARA